MTTLLCLLAIAVLVLVLVLGVLPQCVLSHSKMARPQ
jgi:hypothetical protein